MKQSRQTVEINMEELRRALDGARQGPIGEADYLKLKIALEVLAERLTRMRTQRERPEPWWRRRNLPTSQPRPIPRVAARVKDTVATAPARIRERGRLSSATQALPVAMRARSATRGRVYTQRHPKTLVRVVGQAPVEATVFETGALTLQRLRAGIHSGKPEGIGSK